jgi:hypothetical protein
LNSKDENLSSHNTSFVLCNFFWVVLRSQLKEEMKQKSST